VLIIAVGVLYYLQFSNKTDEEVVQQGDSVKVDLGPLTIAYINSDTLLNNYEFFKETQKVLEKKRKGLEDQYRSRAEGLESEIGSFQRTVNSMTIGQARAVEEDLKKKQQNLLLFRDNLSQSLLIEENKAQNNIYDRVSKFLETYGKENNYHVVLTYQRGSGVLYANEGLEITKEVLEGINEEFRLEKEGSGQVQDTTQQN